MINKKNKIKQKRLFWNDVIFVYGYRSNDIKLLLVTVQKTIGTFCFSNHKQLLHCQSTDRFDSFVIFAEVKSWPVTVHNFGPVFFWLLVFWYHAQLGWILLCLWRCTLVATEHYPQLEIQNIGFAAVTSWIPTF